MVVDYNTIPDAIRILIEKVDVLTAQLASLSKSDKTDSCNLDMDGWIDLFSEVKRN